VISVPAGINCGADCTENYVTGTQVTLTATPVAGYKLINWSGDCTGNQPTVTVTMDKAKNCSVNFAQFFTVSTNKIGQGTVGNGGEYMAGSMWLGQQSV